jgi:hypothetical protein
MNHSVDIVVLGQTAPKIQLDISLTNRTGQPITIYEHSLPWVGYYSLMLVAVSADSPGTVLEKQRPIDDPGPNLATLEAGETRSGTIDLPRRFPGLVDALKQRDVVAFWSYACTPVEGAPLPRSAGGLVLSRTT